MNQISHLTDKKFKNLTETQILEVVNFFIEENKYNCTEEYISFEDWYKLENYANNFKINNVVQYFENHFFGIETLKEFFKYWS